MRWAKDPKKCCGPLTSFSNGRRKKIAARTLTEGREIEQTARLLPRSLGDFTREEGGYGRRDSTWPVRPADARAGFSSVVLVGSPLAVPHGTKDQPDLSLTHSGEPIETRGTQAPGIDEVSPDWKFASPDIERVMRAAKFGQHQ